MIGTKAIVTSGRADYYNSLFIAYNFAYIPPA